MTKLLPSGLRNVLVSAVYYMRLARRLGASGGQTCPICRFAGRFPPYGLPPRFHARCPKCQSLERHRLFVLCDRAHGFFNDGQSVLHFAPENAIKDYVSGKVRDYKTADLSEGRAELQLDIENIALPEASVDVVIANHVLEHVDDEKAIREVFRVLRPGGRFLSMVPIIEGWAHTYENPSIIEPKERERHFGQHDHVRYYGRDYRERLTAAGFKLREFCATGEECVRYGVIRGAKVFIADKPER